MSSDVSRPSRPADPPDDRGAAIVTPSAREAPPGDDGVDDGVDDGSVGRHEVEPDDANVADDLDREPHVARTTVWLDALTSRLATVHPAAWLTAIAAGLFAVIFGRLGVQHYRNFGTWSYDMAIYDQGFWLVSRGKSFMTVRGLDFWGHHTNLIVLAFVPFYWMGAGPSFLYVVQAMVLGAGAFPTYLLARDRTRNPWVGFVFAIVFLLYAPVQWIAQSNFHPEALVITPLLYAWWYATQRRWRPTFIALAIALSTREDTALLVIVMGAVLWLMLRRDDDADRRDRRMALWISLLGVGWYVFTTRLFIPAFNRWQAPFYVEAFYGNYGSSTGEIVREVLGRPDRVVSDATQPDRLRFYRDLFLPWGGLPLGGLLQLAMAGPQMLASVIGLSPYARSIRYQYTSVMIAPIVIASIEATGWMWRYSFVRRYLVPWLLVCAYVTNIAWSPAPWGPNDGVWATPQPRHEAMREALDLVPDDASVTATYALGPHLAHREQLYDWPNPFVPAYWGNDDTYRLPDPSEIEYLALDLTQVGSDRMELLDGLIGADGDYEVVFQDQDVIVAHRTG